MSIKKRIKKVKDKSKLSNVNYMNKIKENVKISIKDIIISELEKQIQSKDIERYGKTYDGVIQDTTKLIMKDYQTGNVGTLDRQLVQGNWERDKIKILKYEAHAPQYKKDTPYFFKNDAYKITKNENNYFVELSFFSISGFEKHNLKVGTKLIFQIDKIDNSKKSILNRMINKEYKQGSAQIRLSEKGKIEFTMSYEFKSKTLKLDTNRILGIDLGIVNTLSMAIWDDTLQKHDYVNYKYNIINGNELIVFRQKLHNMGMSEKEIQDEIFKYNQQLHQKQLNKKDIGCINGLELLKFRQTTDKQKKDLQIASKYVGHGRKGHGRATRMKPIYKIRDKVSKFADTFNHKYSKYVVEFAKSNNCGIIQMEDLSGSSVHTKEKFLKDWNYNDLQNKIEYKAKREGIAVVYIKPQYTSKRCSKCGCIHEDNRDCKNNQAKFKCIVCGYEENADINAAKNIAIPNIDEIIREQIYSKKAN